MDILSFALGYKKGKSTGGGGGSSSDERVKYVTFMYGEVELLKYPVISGDTCHDPVADGLIDTPTKEQTVSTVYTYSGWSLTDGGAASSTALANVTEDRTVYVAFEESARKYTIRYFDGDTLLKTEQVAYGTKPSYLPEKEGVTFKEWSPVIVAVVGDADYYAQWQEKPTFAGSSWNEIVSISESGQAKEYFNVGDKRTETLDDGTTLTLKIIGFNHDDKADGTGKAGMTILSYTRFADTTTVENWQTVASMMRTTLKPKLPTVLQNAIKPVVKACDTDSPTSRGTSQDVTFDLFPLSAEEMKIKRYAGRYGTDADWTDYFAKLGTTYEYFESVYGSYNGPYNDLDYGISFSTTSTAPWLRQWLKDGSTRKGLYTQKSIGSTSVKWFAPAEITTQRCPMFAFCI